MGTDVRKLKLEGQVRGDWIALRDFLVDSLNDCEPAQRAPLVARLQFVLEKLDGMPVEEASKVDELLARRKTRAQERSAG